MPTVAVQLHPRTASQGLLSQALEARIAAPCLPAAGDNSCVRRSRVQSSYHCLRRIQAALRSAANSSRPLVSAAIWIGRSWGPCFVAFLATSQMELYRAPNLNGDICGLISALCAGMHLDVYYMERTGVPRRLLIAVSDVGLTEGASFSRRGSEFDDALTSNVIVWDARFEGVRVGRQYTGGVHVR
jgi:hypothetical protein